jgi:hypothetical protein
MIEGLQILAKYEDRGLDTRLGGADHDIFGQLRQATIASMTTMF